MSSSPNAVMMSTEPVTPTPRPLVGDAVHAELGTVTVSPAEQIHQTNAVVETNLKTQSPPPLPPPPSHTHSSPEKPRKIPRHHSDSPGGSDTKVVNMINSTKIVIKALNTNPLVPSIATTTSSPPPPTKEFVVVDSTQEPDNNSRLDADTTGPPFLDFADEPLVTPALKMSRECMLLQRTVNESKMLTEYLNDSDSRSRKAKRSSAGMRSNGDDGSDNESSASAAFIAQRSRRLTLDSRLTASTRGSRSSQSPSSGKRPSSQTPEGKPPRRNMRSQNAEFSAKHQKFLISIQQQQQEQDSDASEISDHVVLDGACGEMPFEGTADDENLPPRPGADIFCWHCHKPRTHLACTTCRRSFHTYCQRTKLSLISEDTWRCFECLESDPSNATKKGKYTRDELTTMLKFALKRCQLEIMNKSIIFPCNSATIVNEMSLSILDSKVNTKQYETTAAFMSDMKWIMHNCIVSGDQTAKKMTAIRNMLRTVKQEMYDIDTCPECYYNANTRRHNWFEEVCQRPHILLWAKMKGFPYWPAKAMGVNSGSNAGTLVDVRFFGEHDRSWVPVRDCYLFSKEDPNPPGYKYKRNNIMDSMKEVDIYIKKITLKFGSFTFAPRKHTYNPEAENEQLEMLIPNVNKAQPLQGPRPDLTFKIVKTADNNMSIVKKFDTSLSGASTSSTSSSMEIVRTAAPPEPTRNQHANNLTNNNSFGLVKNGNMNVRVMVNKAPMLHTYQVMNQANVDAECGDALNDGKVKAVILKRKSQGVLTADDRKKSKLETSPKPNKPVESHPEQSFSMYDDSVPVECVNLVDSPVTVVDSPVTVADSPVTVTDSPVTVTDSPVTVTDSPVTVTETVTVTEANPGSISSSVVCINDTESSSNALNSSADSQRSVHLDDSHFYLPEVKQEELDEEPVTLSSSQSSLNASDATKRSVKSEPVSSDDELFGEDMVSEPATVEPATVQPVKPADASANHTTPAPVPHRGNITVKDMAQLKNPVLPKKPIKPCPKLKTVFENAKSKDTKSIKAQLPPGITITPKLNNFNSMVYIPMGDGKHFTNESRISRPKDTTAGRPAVSITARSQPPPLTPVPASMHSSFLTVNQILSEMPPATTIMSIAPTVNHMTVSASCPPPLSMVTPIVTSSSVPSIASAPPPTNSTPSTVSTPPQLYHHGGAAKAQQPPAVDGQQTRLFLGDLVPDGLAQAVTDALTRGTMPRLVPKPTGPLHSDGAGYSTPIDAGPVSKLLTENSQKMADYFRSIIEDTLADLAGTSANPAGNLLEAQLRLAELENERLRAAHADELHQLRTNTDRILSEMQKSLETEKTRVIAETRRQCEFERISSVENTKLRQWCVICRKEAHYYCCWNTSYCSFPCQQKHWVRHMPHCIQKDQINLNPATPPPLSGKTGKKSGKNARATAAPQRNPMVCAKLTPIKPYPTLHRMPPQPATSFTLPNRPINCVVVSAAPSPTTHIPNNHQQQLHSYSAAVGGSSLLLSSAAQSGNPSEPQMLRIVATTNLTNN